MPLPETRGWSGNLPPGVTLYKSLGEKMKKVLVVIVVVLATIVFINGKSAANKAVDKTINHKQAVEKSYGL